MRRSVGFFPLAMLWASTVTAEGSGSSSRGESYTIFTGHTVGYNANVFHAHAGWPGISVGLLHGITDRIDIGGTFTFNYGVEGSTEIPEPGIKIQFNTRFFLLDTGKINLGFHFDPGFLVYFYPGFIGTIAGLTVPVGLSLGVPIMSNFLLHFGFDVPLFFTFGNGSFTGIPILAGGGFEYFIDRNFSINFMLRLGPTIDVNGQGSNTVFTLYALFGVAYKF